MNTTAPLLAAVVALGLSPLHAELPSADDILERLGDSARAEAMELFSSTVAPEVRKLLEPGAGAPAATVQVIDNTVFLRTGAAAPRPVFSSPLQIRGALSNPSGSLIAVSTGSGSAGDSIFFLHRVRHTNGVRYVRENLDHAVQLFVEDIYALDPQLVRRPNRLFLKPSAVHRGPDAGAPEFQFTVTGDMDLAGRHLNLTITETGKPILFHGACDQ